MSLYILDPGHHESAGTRHNGIAEGEYTLAICTFARHSLMMRGHTVAITRGPLDNPSFAARAMIATNSNAVGTIVIHANEGAAGSEGEHGPLAFWRGHDPFELAACEAMIKRLGRPGAYVDTATGALKPMKRQVWIARSDPPKDWEFLARCWSTLCQHSKPAALLEVEYTTHAPSALWMIENAPLIGEAIADGAEALGG